MLRHSFVRFAGIVLAGLAFLCISVAASAAPIVHEITFDPDVGADFVGTLTVDDSQLIPNNQISCPSECIDFDVTFDIAVFGLNDVIENLFANTDATGVITSMNVLMIDSSAPGASGWDLDMNPDGTYAITDNPVVSSGTFTIDAVPEPSTSALLALGLVGLCVRRRSRV